MFMLYLRFIFFFSFSLSSVFFYFHFSFFSSAAFFSSSRGLFPVLLFLSFILLFFFFSFFSVGYPSIFLLSILFHVFFSFFVFFSFVHVHLYYSVRQSCQTVFFPFSFFFFSVWLHFFSFFFPLAYLQTVYPLVQVRNHVMLVCTPSAANHNKCCISGEKVATRTLKSYTPSFYLRNTSKIGCVSERERERERGGLKGTAKIRYLHIYTMWR